MAADKYRDKCLSELHLSAAAEKTAWYYTGASPFAETLPGNDNSGNSPGHMEHTLGGSAVRPLPRDYDPGPFEELLPDAGRSIINYTETTIAD